MGKSQRALKQEARAQRRMAARREGREIMRAALDEAQTDVRSSLDLAFLALAGQGPAPVSPLQAAKGLYRTALGHAQIISELSKNFRSLKPSIHRATTVMRAAESRLGRLEVVTLEELSGAQVVDMKGDVPEGPLSAGVPPSPISDDDASDASKNTRSPAPKKPWYPGTPGDPMMSPDLVTLSNIVIELLEELERVLHR